VFLPFCPVSGKIGQKTKKKGQNINTPRIIMVFENKNNR
jgi:hypothetical protein